MMGGAASTAPAYTCRGGRAWPVRWPWPRSAAHARHHAVLLAVILWIAAAVVGLAGPGDRGIAGPLKGADFVQFYTLGHLAAARDVATMYDGAAYYAAQVRLVPASWGDIYPAVYPPQAAVIFAPAAAWSYRGALFVWWLVTIAAYAAIVWHAWRAVAGALPDRVLVGAAAAAFPPFWSLVLHGQVTILVLAAFWAGWLALERGRPWLAGLALGLLGLKPQFGLPLVVVVLACGEWRLLAGALTSAALQVGVVTLVLGPEAIRAFAEQIPIVLAHADALEAKPFMSHSLRSLTRLAPGWLGPAAWVAVAGPALWACVRVWRSAAPLRVRFGMLIVAAVLVNPHLIVYDATVLVLPLLWGAAYVQEPARRHLAAGFGLLVYWLFVTLLAPTAAAIGVQVSVLLMTALFALLARAALADQPTGLVTTGES